MLYTAKEIANYIVNKCIDDGCPITTLNLQRMLYLVQKNVINIGRGLAFGDDIEAWGCGPVVPSVYYYYGRYGAMQITDLVCAPDIMCYDEEILSCIVEKYEFAKPWDLAKEIVGKDSAWRRNYTNPYSKPIIPIQDIIAYG